jgi:hypothetical protein
MPASPDPLTRWLGLDFTRSERRHNLEARNFLAELLGYPKNRVITEGYQGEVVLESVPNPEGLDGSSQCVRWGHPKSGGRFPLRNKKMR